MRERHHFTTALLSLLLIFTMMMAGGCRRDFTTEADVLRERVMVLERQIETLERRNAELRSELRRAAQRHEPTAEEVLAATPRVAELSIGRLSHGRLAGDEDDRDVLRIYVNPIDGRGRFVPLVGTVRVHAAIMPDDEEAVTVARITRNPEQVRDAYRSSFTGTHYTIHLPVDWPEGVDAEAARAEPIIVRVVYDDGHTGERFSAERSIRWREPPPRRRGGSR